jgi:phage shock protein A
VGLLTRIKAILGAKMEKGLDAVENPKEMLDYSISQMEQSLKDMTRHTVEVATAKRKLEIQRDSNLANAKNYEELAQKALTMGQEELAREALNKKHQEEERTQVLAKQITALEEKLTIITKNQKEMRHKIELFRAKKEELKAVYDASQAQLKVKEILTSLGKESQNVAEIVERAEAKIKHTEARVQAIDHLLEEGVVEEILPLQENDVEQRLAKLSKDAAVEEDLKRLKAQMANKS